MEVIMKNLKRVLSFVVALVMILALVLGIGAAYYLLYVLVGWLFCQAVFFTVKLM